MTENPTPTPNPAVPNPAPGVSGSPFKVFATKEQYEAALNRKLGNYAPKSELQTAIDRASSMEKALGGKDTEIQDLKNKLLNYQLGDLKKKVGSEAGLPPDWIDELKGADEASLKAHAESLRKKLGIKHKDGNPVPPITPGTPKTESEEMNGMFISMARGGGSGR